MNPVRNKKSEIFADTPKASRISNGMNKTPTVFLTNFHPFVSRNILNSGALDSFSKNSKVILFVFKDKESYFKDIYQKENVIVEGIDLSREIKSRRNKFFIRISEWLLDTNFMKVHKMDVLDKVSNRFNYYFSLIFTKVFTPIVPFKKFIRWLDYQLNNPKPSQSYFDKYKPDLVFATDAFNDADLFLLKNARHLGIKNIAMLRSWDNTTSRGYLRFVPNKLIVHNEIMKKEMIKHHNVPKDIINLSGIPQFEKYLGMKPTPRGEFYKKIEADPSKRLILFAPAGHHFIDTDWQICQILKDLQNEKKIPQDIQFLVRIHPFLWVDLSRFEPGHNFIIDSPGPASSESPSGKKEGELDKTFFQHIYNSLYYSSLIINSMSSIIIDSMVFDKPLITINFDGWERPEAVPFLRSLPRRWRREDNQISWMSFGSTALVSDKEELTLWINRYLENPGIHSRERKAFKEAYCWRYDGMASERIAEICLK